jgi:hypothetical protein
MRNRFGRVKPRSPGCVRAMCAASRSTTLAPHSAAAILRLMCSPICQYNSISAVLIAW